MKSIKDFFHKTFTSRKFWAAVAASGPLVATGDYHGAAYVWMTYAGIQGTVDAAEKFKSVAAPLAELAVLPGDSDDA